MHTHTHTHTHTHSHTHTHTHIFISIITSTVASGSSVMRITKATADEVLCSEWQVNRTLQHWTLLLSFPHCVLCFYCLHLGSDNSTAIMHTLAAHMGLTTMSWSGTEPTRHAGHVCAINQYSTFTHSTPTFLIA